MLYQVMRSDGDVDQGRIFNGVSVVLIFNFHQNLYGAIILQVFPCWILKGVSGLQIEGVQSSSWQF